MGITEGSPFQTKGTAHAKVLRQEQDWRVQKTARRPVWLEPSEEDLEGEEIDDGAKVRAGATRALEDILSFTLERVAPREFEAEK